MGLPDNVKDVYITTYSVQQIMPERLKNGNSEKDCFLNWEGVPDDKELSKDSGDFILWSEFKNGSKKALTLIYNQYIYSLYNYGEMLTSQKDLIEDSIHDLFVDLWKNRENLGQALSIKYYLYKGLKRKIIKNLSLKRRLPIYEFSEAAHPTIVFSHEFNLITSEISEEQKQNLLKAINQLSARQKEAILLRFYENLSYREIGGLLSISVKSTYTLIYRAIEVLKLKIGKINI